MGIILEVANSGVAGEKRPQSAGKNERNKRRIFFMESPGAVFSAFIIFVRGGNMKAEFPGGSLWRSRKTPNKDE